MNFEDEDYEEDEANNFAVPTPTPTNSPLSGKRIWVLYFGEENGSREDCSIFYTDTEGFENEADALAREKQLQAVNSQNPTFYTQVNFITLV